MSIDSRSVLIERLFPNSVASKIAKTQTWHSHVKIVAEIKRGFVSLGDHRGQLDNHMSHSVKEEALKKIFYSDDYYNYERDQRIMLNLPEPPPSIRKPRRKVIKEEAVVNLKKSDGDIKREFVQKLKEWEKQKGRLARKRRQLEMKKQLNQSNSQEKRRKEEGEIHQFLRLQKRKVIQARIKGMEDRKLKRYEILHQSSVKRSQSVPKFIQNENRFKSQQLQKSLQREIIIKNRRQSLQMDMEQIKQHEKAYVQRIKDRLNIKSQKNLHRSAENSRQEDFSLVKKDAKQMKILEDKIKKVRKFQDKVRLLPVKVDTEKKKEAMIHQDKVKNARKYNFLSQKALSDQQIFEHFKEFDINVDRYEVGNKYLKQAINQAKQQNPGLRRKVSSEKVLPKERPQYKNYLQQLRHNKKKSIINPDQFDSYAQQMKQLKYREHGKQLLKHQSELFEKKVITNIKQLQGINNYNNSIKKEQQIDDNFSKALQAKLALAKIT